MESEPEESAHDRRSKRSLVLLAAKVRIGDVTQDVRLRNLSRTGALLEAKKVPPPDTKLIFERGDTVVPACVVWAAAPRFGIRFDTPIEESELLVHIGPVRRQPPAPPPPTLRRI